MSKARARQIHLPLVDDFEEERPFIAVSCQVEGNVWSTLTMGRRSGHPFTTKRLQDSEDRSTDVSVMVLYAALCMFRPPLAYRMADVLEFLDQLIEEDEEGVEELPF